jgi:hypothetical protein
MERSIAIIDSSSRPGRLVAIVELQGQGKPVVAALEVDGTGSMRGKRIDSNAVASVYFKTNVPENRLIARILLRAIDLPAGLTTNSN